MSGCAPGPAESFFQGPCGIRLADWAVKRLFVCRLFSVALRSANLEQWEIDGFGGKDPENVSHLTTSLYFTGGGAEDNLEGSKEKKKKFSTT